MSVTIVTFVNNTYLYSILYNIGLSNLTTKLMTDEHRRLLTKVKPKLVPRLRLTPVLIELQANDALTTFDYQTIKSKRADYEANECLIDTLGTYPDIAFYKFKEALEETDQPHLAKLLEEPATDTPGLFPHEAVTSPQDYRNMEQLDIESSNTRGK